MSCYCSVLIAADVSQRLIYSLLYVARQIWFLRFRSHFSEYIAGTQDFRALVLLKLLVLFQFC